MRLQLATVFLLGMIAASLIVMALGERGQPVFAQTSGTSGGVIAVTANSEVGARNMVWVINTASGAPRLALYEAKQGNRLEMLSVRNLTWDFLYDQYPGTKASQRPSVDEVRKETKKRDKSNDK